MLNVQVTWEPTFHYKTHIATAALDFSLDTQQRVSFNNVLYDGSVIPKANWVTVDNTSNPSPVTFKDGSLDIQVLPFERATHKLMSSAGYLDFFGSMGITRVTFSETEYVKTASADNLYGNIFPSLKNYQQTYIAASVAGLNPSHTITLNAGEICVIAIMCQNGFNLTYNFTTGSYDDLETFNQANSVGLTDPKLHTRWFGIPYTQTQFADLGDFNDKITNFRSGAAGVNYTRIGFVRAINPVTFTIDVNNGIGDPLRYTTFILNNCQSGDALDTLSDTRSLSGGSNPVITSLGAATQYTLPAVNLSGLKRFVLMCTGSTNTALASAQAVGAVALAERFDANGVSFSNGWIEKAGTTDNPVFTHAAAAGQTLEYAVLFLKGPK